MTTFKHFRKRLNQMTDQTYALLRCALLVSCTMVICAAVLFIAGGGPTFAGFDAYMVSRELIALGSVTLLVATIASAIVEELTRKK